MPSVEHQAPLELLREDPRLAAVLVANLGIPVPARYSARVADGDVTAAVPAQLLTDKVILLVGEDTVTVEERARRKKRKAKNAGEGELAIVVEVQRTYEEEKWWTWPAYLAQVRARYLCDAPLTGWQITLCSSVARRPPGPASRWRSS